MMDRRRLLLALSVPALALGCAATPPAPPASSPVAAEAVATAVPADLAPDEAALPPLLRGLDLKPAQVAAVLKLNDDLDRDGDTFLSAADALGRSVAGAARQCKGETPFVDMDASRVVREGEAMRAEVIDAAQAVHRILTPAQRKKVSDRMVEADDWAKRERKNASRTRELGPALDLSTMQLMKMLVKAGVLWNEFADRAEPWRSKYRAAIVDFAKDDFDVHAEPVASVPVVAFFVEFARTGLRLMIPILEPKQCEALSKLIEEKLDESAHLRAERNAHRARVLAELKKR